MSETPFPTVPRPAAPPSGTPSGSYSAPARQAHRPYASRSAHQSPPRTGTTRLSTNTTNPTVSSATPSYTGSSLPSTRYGYGLRSSYRPSKTGNYSTQPSSSKPTTDVTSKPKFDEQPASRPKRKWWRQLLCCLGK